MTISDVFERITIALDTAGIEYMLAGSFASTRYSSPRSTQDIDVVISTTPEQLRALVQDLAGKNYYVELDAAIEAHRRNSMFNIIDMDTGWKIDLIFRKPTAFGLEEFSRRRKIELHGIQLFIASPEDVVIAKLEWARKGASQRQIEDAAAVLRVQGEALDKAYLVEWISRLNLQEEWLAAQRLNPPDEMSSPL